MIANATATDNPLLISKGLPPFEAIKPEHVVPAMTQLLAELDEELAKLEAKVTPTWDGLVEPLDRLGERLTWTWGVISHLMGVKNSPELREAYETVQPKVVQFSNKLNQSQPLYKAFKALREGDDWSSLEPAQKRIVEAAIRDAELSGVGLEGEKRDSEAISEKDRFNAIQLELAELSTKFSNNVLDATKAFSMTLTSKDEVDGLPPSLTSLAAQAAREAGEENATAENGPWRITLDYPSYVPFMQHSTRRDLREKLYKAFVSRASTGELDNTSLIERILELRKEKAALLGYESFAELSLASKMAPNVEAVEGLLEELRRASYEAAVKDLEELKAFAAAKGAEEANDLKHWDISFWAERQQEEKFAFSAEELRPYFPLPQVLDGLFSLVKRLFGVTVTAADGTAPVWHEDVRYFQIADETGTPIANFYLDPYSRPAEKRGGAWMDDCIGRAKIYENGTSTTRLPVAYLVCNQTPPVDDKPSLMTFNEVETLFHEFGHGLQHMLTKVDYAGASGINNVEWDAVELPSQFMENWCYDRPTLMGMAKHYETGEPLPEHYYQKLLAARHYMSGSAMLRQLHFSRIDLELHHRYLPGGNETAVDVRKRIAKTTTILPPLPEDNFLCAFGHIFAGGYAAGYYSYKWAEVLSADAFAAFEDAGLDNEEAIATTGKRYRDTVLALGGSLPPMEVFKAFRGREPSTEPLLKHSGLVTAS
ncbi:MAG: M3 family metallopeptidase [Symplocastrum torsivum CPER-KK1]|jgi:oligopeptidase A|uniref:oligopeptidase A n=1 Tax=Symplocastrum torsivum CPER-KK1 TaxID=450513 RepID=A0A951UA75_9CYAN|nr:M3 family metallopeptidase [Symplocastrum torsivum CPER-KK1]